VLHISRSRGTYVSSLERATVPYVVVSRHIPHLILGTAVGGAVERAVTAESYTLLSLDEEQCNAFASRELPAPSPPKPFIFCS
jgi:hypothetical protein